MDLEGMLINVLVQCPLDPNHKVAKTKLQYHLIKCLKQYKGTKLRCPYMATEYVEKDEMLVHLASCKHRPDPHI